MNGSFVRVAAVSPRVFLGHCKENQKSISHYLTQLEKKGVQVCLFPELCLTGATCADLFFQTSLQKSALHQLETLVNHSGSAIGIVGLPFALDSRLYNVSAVFQKGALLAMVPKKISPQGEESRWFSTYEGENRQISLFGQVIPFGNDLCFSQNEAAFTLSSGLYTYEGGNNAPLVFVSAGACHTLGSQVQTKEQLAARSRSEVAAYVYANAGYGESTTDKVFSGACAIYENGDFLTERPPFLDKEGYCIQDIDLGRLLFKRRQASPVQNHHPLLEVAVDFGKNPPAPLYRQVNATPFIAPKPLIVDQVREVFAIQARALQSRLEATGINHVVLGVSGGLDSTLALLAAAHTLTQMGLPSQNIHGLIMPGFGTTQRTKGNGTALAHLLGCTVKEIDITPAVKQHFKDIGHPEDLQDVTYENSQARERTQILMDYANQAGGLVLGTGNLSEGALGFSTYNGDHMSMYALNASIPKTLVKALVFEAGELFFTPQVAAICRDIVSTPISPELLPSGEHTEPVQKTEEILGSYDLHDFFLYHLMDSGSDYNKLSLLAQRAFEGRFTKEEIENTLTLFLRRFIQQQYKRSCAPDGPQVVFFSFSPRGGLMLPSDLRVEGLLEK